ncbi:MAG: hypothetical protein KAR11_08160 [Phycisphaerae bacterium]|nr:hypothetical protein [Phycisphaerae bacterium]
MTQETNSSIHLRYKGFENTGDSCLDLTDLGKSLVGFDKLLRELVKITNVNGEVSIKATAFRDGSVIVDLLIKLQELANQVPFDSTDDLLDYLKLVNDIAWKEAVHYFQKISSTSKSVYDYLSQHPVKLTGISIVLVKLIELATKNKDQPCSDCDGIPKRVALELNKLIKNKRGFKKALKPLIEDKASSIEVSSDRKFKKRVSINQSNFHEYLGEEEKILPHLENGARHSLIGEITSLKSTRGDSLTFKYTYKKRIYYLDLLPPDGISTKEYTDYYKEKVVIESEIVRTSFYKKPKLKLSTIKFHQQKLFIKE